MSVIQKSSAPSLTDPAQWPHLVVTLASLYQSEGFQNTGAEMDQKPRNAVFKELADRNRMLSAAGKYETVLCPDFFEEHPTATRNNLWGMIKITAHFCWVLKGTDPANAVSKLPGDWGTDGYANVCITVGLDEAAALNWERILALSRLPARHRALWINPATSFTKFSRSDTGIGWVIIDTTNLSESVASSEAITPWITEISSACQVRGIAVYHNGRNREHGPWQATEKSLAAEHPFSHEMDLSRSSIETGLPCGVTHTRPADIDIAVLQEESAIPNVEPVASADESTSSVDPLPSGSNAFPPELVMEVWGSDLVEPANAEELAENSSLPTSKQERFIKLDKIAREALRSFVDTGLALAQIRECELWREGGYASWEAYCTSLLGMSRNYANRLIKSAAITDELRRTVQADDAEGDPRGPINESQVRPLAKLPDPGRRLDAWQQALKRDAGTPSAATVSKVVAELMAEDPPCTSPTQSRKERRLELLDLLCEAAEAKTSWGVVMDLVAKIKLLN